MGEPNLSKLKVLVADDEPKLRALVTKCVQALGCEVVEASDGDEAWQMAEQRSPDVVILDVMMPGMSGWDVCRRIKSAAVTARGARPKVLMLTGIGEHLNEMTSPLFAADDWINKPFDLDVLREKVAELGQEALDEHGPLDPAMGPSIKKARPSDVDSVTIEPLSDLDDSMVDVEGETPSEAAPVTIDMNKPSPAAEAAGVSARESRASAGPPAAGAGSTARKTASLTARTAKKAAKRVAKAAKKAAKLAKKAMKKPARPAKEAKPAKATKKAKPATAAKKAKPAKATKKAKPATAAKKAKPAKAAKKAKPAKTAKKAKPTKASKKTKPAKKAKATKKPAKRAQPGKKAKASTQVRAGKKAAKKAAGKAGGKKAAARRAKKRAAGKK